VTLPDVLITIAVLSASAWLLYRSVWTRRGACHGCSGGCRPTARDGGAALVSLGSGPHRGTAAGGPPADGPPPQERST
jgi:hypothetical protein